MDWVFLFTGVVFFSLVLVGPGFLIARNAQYDIPSALAVATPITAFWVVVLSWSARKIGVPWSLTWFVPSIAVVVFCLGIASYYFTKFGRVKQQINPSQCAWNFREKATVLGAFAVGGVVTASRILIALKEPDAFSQTFDGVFHINLVKLISESGNASILEMSLTDVETRRGFYPAVWHQFVSLLEPLLGDVYISANAMGITIVTVLFPLTLAGLLWNIFPGNKLLYSVALLFANIIPQAILLALDFGVLYPNLLANSIGLAVLVALLCLLNIRSLIDLSSRLMIFIVVALGVAFTHPGVILLVSFGCALILMNWLANYSIQFLDIKKPIISVFLTAGIITVGFAAYIVLFDRLTWRVPAFANLRGGGIYWLPEYDGRLEAAFHGFTASASVFFGSYWKTGLVFSVLVTLASVVLFAKQKNSWIVYFYLTTLALYSIAGGDWNHSRKQSLTGLWYGDSNRISMFLGIGMILLVTIAITYLIQKIKTPKKRLALLITFFIIGQLLPVNSAMYNQLSEDYQKAVSESDTGYLLSKDEVSLLKRISEEVPEDAMILGNPWEGTTFAWPLANRKVLFAHLGDSPSGELKEIADGLNDRTKIVRNCELLEKYNSYYILDFKNWYLWDGKDGVGRHKKYDGLKYLDRLGLAEVIDEEGQAKLLKFTACEKQGGN